MNERDFCAYKYVTASGFFEDRLQTPMVRDVDLSAKINKKTVEDQQSFNETVAEVDPLDLMGSLRNSES